LYTSYADAGRNWWRIIMSEHIPDTGYDKKLNVNYSILLSTLKALDFDDFLRACPRYPEFVTEIDIEKLYIFHSIAESWSGEKIKMSDNLTDRHEFEKTKGEIIAAITREIKRGDPRNLEFESVEKSMKEMNDLTVKVIGDILFSEDFINKVREGIIKNDLQKSQVTEGHEEIIHAFDDLRQENEKLKMEIEKIKERASEPSSLPVHMSIISEEAHPLTFSVSRYWEVAVTDQGEIDITNEKREGEEGGDIRVRISDGENELVWPIYCMPSGHSILYERVKKLLSEFLLTGKILSSLTYSNPKDGEIRLFSPEIENGKVKYFDHWEVRGSLFGSRYEKEITVEIGRSAWSFLVRLKTYDVPEFARNITTLINMILLSGEVVSDDRQSFK
ncbi:MAG: hypothetical protein QW292_13050, partial [Candidatus Parvarchaeota archaeon]